MGAREPGGRAIYDSLIVNTHLAASIIFGLAVLYLLAGLISPSLALASGRGEVALRSFLGIFLAIGLAVGVIVYTHMQPDGPCRRHLRRRRQPNHKVTGTAGNLGRDTLCADFLECSLGSW